MGRCLLSFILAMAVTVPLVRVRAASEGDAGFGKVTKPFVQESVALRMKDGFGAEFWFVDDETTLPKWLSGDVRDIVQVSVVKRRRSVRLIVFIFNPGSHPFKVSGKEESYSDVTYDVLVRRPDGVRYVGAQGVTAWDGPVPPPHFIQTAEVTVTDSFRKIDPLGEYTIMVVVHDNVRKLDLPLIHTLKVRE